jgi:hypothetical protein
MNYFMCPHCNLPFCLTPENHSAHVQPARLNLTGFGDRPREGLNDFRVVTHLYTCTNRNCGLSSIFFEIRTDYEEPRGIALGDEPQQVQRRRLLKKVQIVPPPKPKVRRLPATVPLIIRQDYEEAQLIRDISPKASAALARRCLQGMIRDRHKIIGKNLHNEIQALKSKVDDQRLDAIDSLRWIGNIGAHPEENLDVIIDITANEAAETLRFVETLIDDWYVNRHVKDSIEHAVIRIADEIKSRKPK